MRGITARPCDGKKYAGWTLKERMTKVTEEFGEVVVALRNYTRQRERNQLLSTQYQGTGADAERILKQQVALELTDLKTACESMLYALGLDKQARDGLQDKVNKRNAEREGGTRVKAAGREGIGKKEAARADAAAGGVPAYYEGLDGRDVYYIARNWRLDFVRSNAIKYIIRMGRKTGDVDADCRKAIHSLKRLLEVKL